MSLIPPEYAITASEALDRFRQGSLRPVEYLEACLRAIRESEPELRAFATLDTDAALAHAGKHEVGNGLLQGIPIGVKDVIDTASMVTEYNSPLYQGHQPRRDAACISILRAQGAIILGKTATVEFASLGRVAETRNPHNPEHTPGGTSSGSAAAVATGMVPIALGTQTGGSTIRPASFCGVAALKPTFGTVPVEGLKPYSPSLDTISWMARSVADLGQVLHCFGPPGLDNKCESTMRIGYYETPYWDAASEDTRAAMKSLSRMLEENHCDVVRVDVADDEDDLNRAQDLIMHGEGRASYLAEYLTWRDDIHPALRDEVNNVRGITADQLRWAYDYLAAMRVKMEQRLAGFDAWLVPAVPGEAPKGLASTGDAVFNRLWTGLHFPAVALPGFNGETGLPVGLQLVAPRFKDAHLLSVAARVEAIIKEAQ